MDNTTTNNSNNNKDHHDAKPRPSLHVARDAATAAMITTTTADPSSSLNASPLRSAMRLADLIHRQISKHEQELGNENNNKKNNNKNQSWMSIWPTSWKLMPGVVEGLMAGGATILVLTPVRFYFPIIQKNRLFDIVFTMSQVMMSVQASLYVGTLYGSQQYLCKLANMNPQQSSPTATAICQDAVVLNALTLSSSDVVPQQDATTTPSLLANQGSTTTTTTTTSTPWWNPSQAAVMEYQRALLHCRQRNEYQWQQQQQKLRLDDQSTATANDTMFTTSDGEQKSSSWAFWKK